MDLTKSRVESTGGKKLKTFRTDNGGEYTSNQIEEYMRGEGIRHERTIPKTPRLQSKMVLPRDLIEHLLDRLDRCY